MAVGTFKRPDLVDISDKDLENDIMKAWSDLDKSVIAESLISGICLFHVKNDKNVKSVISDHISFMLHMLHYFDEIFIATYFSKRNNCV